MSNRYAIIKDGLVANVVVADAEFAATQGWVECPTAGPNWKYDGTTFTEPDPVPEPAPTPAPTKEQLTAQLTALSAQIQSLE
jgi:hypothetical protein